MALDKLEKVVFVLAGITVCGVIVVMFVMRRSITHPAEIGVNKTKLQLRAPAGPQEKSSPAKRASTAKQPSATSGQSPERGVTVVMQKPSPKILPSNAFVEDKKIDPLFRERYSKYASIIEEVNNIERELVETPYGTAVKLTSIVRGSIVDRIGFVPGDILVAINGRTLGALMDKEGERLYDELKDLEVFEVEIIRNGQPFLLRYQIPLK
jgi:hypothetical protein